MRGGPADADLAKMTAAAPQEARPNRGALTFIFITVLLDTMALGMVLPVLPHLITQLLVGHPLSAKMVHRLHRLPGGTVSMAAFMQAQGEGKPDSMAAMPGMNMSEQHSEALPNQVSFPYGFPSAGRYRAFVQMKHGNVVETGVFDMQAY